MNKLLKTLIAGVSALTMCISAMSLSASAATTSYKKGDVNGDGVVNSVDVLECKKFLLGKVSADGATFERLDTNKNFIVDNVDYQTIRNINLGLENSVQITSTNTDGSSDYNTYVQYELTYNKFNAVNGSKIEQYTIPAVSKISTSSPRSGIINGDDRVIDYNQSSVVVLTNGTKVIGTGFIVDSDKIVTAAHVLYDTESNVAQNNIKYILFNSKGQKIDINGNVVSNQNSYMGISADSYHIPEYYVRASDYGESGGNGDALAHGFYQDYALIKVNQDLSKYQSLNVGMVRNGIKNVASTQELFVTGYNTDNKTTSDVNGANSQLLGKIVTGSGHLCSFPLNSVYMLSRTNLFYDVDVLSGESGGPIYIKNDDGSKTVIGINTGMNRSGCYNQGTRFDTKILTFMFNNPKF